MGLRFRYMEDLVLYIKRSTNSYTRLHKKLFNRFFFVKYMMRSLILFSEIQRVRMNYRIRGTARSEQPKQTAWNCPAVARKECRI